MFIRRALALSVVLAAVVITAGASAKPPKDDVCYSFRTQVRYGALAWNHFVYIANTCAAPADCVVTTSVNPDAIKTVVPPHDEVEVVTFLGSPAREFTANVECHPQH